MFKTLKKKFLLMCLNITNWCLNDLKLKVFDHSLSTKCDSPAGMHVSF